jgi:hypothetical protein
MRGGMAARQEMDRSNAHNAGKISVARPPPRQALCVSGSQRGLRILIVRRARSLSQRHAMEMAVLVAGPLQLNGATVELVVNADVQSIRFVGE